MDSPYKQLIGNRKSEIGNRKSDIGVVLPRHLLLYMPRKIPSDRQYFWVIDGRISERSLYSVVCFIHFVIERKLAGRGLDSPYKQSEIGNRRSEIGVLLPRLIPGVRSTRYGTSRERSLAVGVPRVKRYTRYQVCIICMYVPLAGRPGGSSS